MSALGQNLRLVTIGLLLGFCTINVTPALGSTAEFKIDQTGTVTANLRLDVPPLVNEPAPAARLIGLLTPCDAPSAHLQKGPDIRAQFISNGPGYSAVALLVPGNVTSVPLTVEHCLALEETSEGKLKVTVDYSYSFAGAIDRTLIPIAPGNWAMQVVLPTEFDETLVAYNPSAVARIDRTTFSLTHTSPAPAAKAAWIVFPNTPTQRQQHAKLVLGLLLGLLTSLIQIPAFRTRRLDLLGGVGVVAALVLALTIYYAVVLPGRLDLLVWMGASIPHLLIALCGSSFVILAKRNQAMIAGMVLADGEPALFGRATLWLKTSSDWKPIETAERLENGKYQFYVWVRRQPLTLKVQAQASNRAIAESRSFSVNPKSQYAVEPLESATISK